MDISEKNDYISDEWIAIQFYVETNAHFRWTFRNSPKG